MHNLHGIDKRSIALEAVNSTLADLAEEIIEGKTKHQNLQYLALVSLTVRPKKVSRPTEFI